MSAPHRASTTVLESPAPVRNRAKYMAAGVAIAATSALAVTPSVISPMASSDVQIQRIEQARADAYGLTAYSSENPIQNAIDFFTRVPGTVSDNGQVPKDNAGLLWQLGNLSKRTAQSWSDLSGAVADPEVPFTNFLTSNFSDPMQIPNALMGFQAKYGESISKAFSASGDDFTEALSGLVNERQARNEGGTLLWKNANGDIVSGNTAPPGGTPHMVPGVLPHLFTTLTTGHYVQIDATTGLVRNTELALCDSTTNCAIRDVRFLEAFGDANLWFLMDIMGDQRQDAVDNNLLRLPGDFLESIGAENLGRILGTSWMTNSVSAPGANFTGLLARNRLGNLARALVAPPITAMFRTADALDDINNAVQDQDFRKALTSIANAPVDITNAFINGYQSPTLHGNGPSSGDAFPGITSMTSTLNFILSEVPGDIANTLTLKKPPAAQNKSLLQGEADDDAPKSEEKLSVKSLLRGGGSSDSSVFSSSSLKDVSTKAQERTKKLQSSIEKRTTNLTNGVKEISNKVKETLGGKKPEAKQAAEKKDNTPKE